MIETQSDLPGDARSCLVLLVIASAASGLSQLLRPGFPPGRRGAPGLGLRGRPGLSTRVHQSVFRDKQVYSGASPSSEADIFSLLNLVFFWSPGFLQVSVCGDAHVFCFLTKYNRKNKQKIKRRQQRVLYLSEYFIKLLRRCYL